VTHFSGAKIAQNGLSHSFRRAKGYRHTSGEGKTHPRASYSVFPLKDDPVRLIRHSVIPNQGSFEVRFADGRPSVYFYWEDDASRRAVNKRLTLEQALEAAKKLARSERDKS